MTNPRTDICGLCGNEIVLAHWAPGRNFKRWVTSLTDKTWKCQPDETQPVRAHFPRVLP